MSVSNASLPLSGRLVTCPWYWEYHAVEFSVPASVQNLELSVPTHLVLTVCKEKPEFCIGMQGNGPFVAQTVLNQNRKNTSRKFGEQVEDKNLQNTSRKLIVRKNLFCCAGRWGKWTFHKLPDDTRTKHVVQKLSRRKTGKIMGASLGS